MLHLLLILVVLFQPCTAFSDPPPPQPLTREAIVPFVWRTSQHPDEAPITLPPTNLGRSCSVCLASKRPHDIIVEASRWACDQGHPQVLPFWISYPGLCPTCFRELGLIKEGFWTCSNGHGGRAKYVHTCKSATCPTRDLTTEQPQ
jgi:hypothetical protein